MSESTRELTNAEVALLGLVSEKPKHAWQIEKDVVHRDTRSWTDLSQSTIYKQLRSLESGGFLDSSSEVVDGRNRKIYTVTDTGQSAVSARLLDLLSEPEHLKWRIDLATYNFDLAPAEEAKAALRTYIARLRKSIKGYQELEEYLRSSGCPSHRLAVARRQIYLLEAEVVWATDFIEEMEGERS